MEHEARVIGSILANEEGFELVQPILTDKDFHHAHLRQLWLLFEEIHKAGRPITVSLVAEELERTNRLENFGGREQLDTMAWYLERTSWQIVNDAHRVKQKAQLRIVHDLCEEAKKAAAAPGLLTVTDICGKLEGGLRAILAETHEGKGVPFSESVIEILDEAERIRKGEIPHYRWFTHYKELDRITDGMTPGCLWIVAARPSAGKTALACNFAHNLAKGGPIIGPPRVPPADVLFLSLEMSRKEITERLLCSLTDLPLSWIRNPDDANADQFGQVVRASQAVSMLPMTIDDQPRLRPMDVRAKVKKWVSMANRPAVVFLDHLNLMRPDRYSRDGRVLDMAEITGDLKALAKEANVCIVCLCQLNRRIEHRAGKGGKLPAPMLSDLRESGAIEQDADLVMFLDRPKLTKDEQKGVPFQECSGIIGKHRNGPLGTIDFLFKAESFRFLPKFQGG